MKVFWNPKPFFQKRFLAGTGQRPVIHQKFLGLKVAQMVSVLDEAWQGPTHIFSVVQKLSPS